jgi:hypothetical protein
MEIWKTFSEVPTYEVSTLGRVRRNGKILKHSISGTGYHQIVFSLGARGLFKSYKVHRLVALTFLPNPQNHQEVDHIDGDKNNNCLSNLQWVTRKGNMMKVDYQGFRTSNTNETYITERNDTRKLRYKFHFESYSKCFATLPEAVAYRDRFMEFSECSALRVKWA